MVMDSKFEQLREHFGIATPEDWCRVRPDEITALHNVGLQTLNHLRLHLANRGLTLANDETPAYWQSELTILRGTSKIADDQEAITTPFTVLVDTGEQLPFTFSGFRADADQGCRPLIVQTRREHLGATHGDYTIDGLQGYYAVSEPTAVVADDAETTATEGSDPWEGDTVSVEAQELQLLDMIYANTVKFYNTRREYRSLEQQLKATQEELNSLQSMQTNLLKDLPENLLKLRDGLTLKDDDKPAVSLDDGNPTQLEHPHGYSNWRDEPTGTILGDIAGLGDKKQVALVEQYPTVGDLFGAYANSVAEKVKFAKKLPKGVGNDIADVLIERLLQFETIHDTPPASEVVEPRVAPETTEVQAEAATSEPEATTASSDETAATTGETRAVKKRKPAEFVAGKDPEHEKWVQHTAAGMSAKYHAMLDKYESQVDADTWADGYAAFGDGLPVIACPGSLTASYCEDWLRGWLLAEINKEAEDFEAEVTGGLAAMLESVKGGEFDGPPKHQDAYDEGYSSGVDGLPIEAVKASYDDAKKLDWVRGWADGSAVGAEL